MAPSPFTLACFQHKEQMEEHEPSTEQAVEVECLKKELELEKTKCQRHGRLAVNRLGSSKSGYARTGARVSCSFSLKCNLAFLCPVEHDVFSGEAVKKSGFHKLLDKPPVIRCKAKKLTHLRHRLWNREIKALTCLGLALSVCGIITCNKYSTD